jgi:hypothetical protein
LKREPRQNLSVTEPTKGVRAIRMECPIQADRMARVVLPEGVPPCVLVLWEVKRVRVLLVEWVLHGVLAWDGW